MSGESFWYGVGYYGFLSVITVLILAGLLGWGMRLVTAIIRGATSVLRRFK